MKPEIEQRHNDLQETIDKLSNGHKGDPHTMSEGIVNISKTLQVMLKMNYISEEDCALKEKYLRDDFVRAQFGWKQLAAVITGCGTLFALGIHLINSIWGSPAAKVIVEAVSQ